MGTDEKKKEDKLGRNRLPRLKPGSTPSGPVDCLTGMGQNLDELFDVVDEQDRVVGRATRREVHARGLRHRAVHVWVFNQAGELFLQKRSMSKDSAPGLWDSSCSGHLDVGEDYDAAARRELSEELGWKLDERGVGASRPRLKRLLRLDACVETGWEFVWLYRTAGEGPFTLHPEEIERGEWVTPAELTRRLASRPQDYSRAFRFIWARATAAGIF
jgi:isopentenyl-diphosphate delta-isomerase